MCCIYIYFKLVSAFLLFGQWTTALGRLDHGAENSVPGPSAKCSSCGAGGAERAVAHHTGAIPHMGRHTWMQRPIVFQWGSWGPVGLLVGPNGAPGASGALVGHKGSDAGR